jgi:hypothetical protein
VRSGLASRKDQIAASLCAEWRMFEEISLSPARDGEGFDALIELNATLVRASTEQQGLGSSPSSWGEAESRRLHAAAECIERFNGRVPPAESIRSFRIAGLIPPA